MKEIWALIGRAIYTITWPVIFLVLKFRKRTSVIIACKSDVLLIKTWLSGGEWSLPGGGLHFGEDAKAGASRELFEELGVRIAPASLKQPDENLSQPSSGGLKLKYYAYIAELEHRPILKPHKLELIDTKWVNINQLPRLQLDDNAQRILKEWLDQPALLE